VIVDISHLSRRGSLLTSCCVDPGGHVASAASDSNGRRRFTRVAATWLSTEWSLYAGLPTVRRRTEVVPRDAQPRWDGGLEDW